MVNGTIPVESMVRRGFFEIPGYSRYLLSKEGVVYDLKKKKEIRGHVVRKGYVLISLYRDSGKRLTWGRHRLLAFVFLRPSKDIDKMVVNHLDGIPGSDGLENLEWTTAKGNIEHAGAMDLTSKCVPISVRDSRSGIVENYPSIQEYARIMGVSKDTINWRIKVGETRVFPEGKQYRKASVTTPWYVPPDIDLAISKNFNRHRILIKFHPSGEVEEFESQSLAARRLDVSPAAITMWLKLKNQPVLHRLTQMKIAEDPTPWRPVGDLYLEYEETTKRKVIIVTEHDTGRKVYFLSNKECEVSMGLKPTTLLYRLASKGRKVFIDGCTYVYYSDTV